MTCIDKIILAFIAVQVVLLLAKPNELVHEDGLYHSNDDMEDFRDKRAVATDCGGGCEPEGCYSRRCRTSCRSGEYHVSMFDDKCGCEQKCCMCHVRWGDCTYDG